MKAIYVNLVFIEMVDVWIQMQQFLFIFPLFLVDRPIQLLEDS